MILSPSSSVKIHIFLESLLEIIRQQTFCFKSLLTSTLCQQRFESKKCHTAMFCLITPSKLSRPQFEFSLKVTMQHKFWPYTIISTNQNKNLLSQPKRLPVTGGKRRSEFLSLWPAFCQTVVRKYVGEKRRSFWIKTKKALRSD